jgi:hypothetical protein
MIGVGQQPFEIKGTFKTAIYYLENQKNVDVFMRNGKLNNNNVIQSKF